MWSARIRKIVHAYLVSIGLWCALSLLTGWNYRIFDEQLNIKSTLFDMILLAESRGFALALLSPIIFYGARHYTVGSKHSLRYLFLYILGVGPFIVAYVCIRWLVLPPWDVGLQQYVPRTRHGPLEMIYSGFSDQITMYIAIVFAAHAYIYFERARKQELERSEYQQAITASELQALKMQLHPHFLFNTLHGIATLIDTDPKSAGAMIVKLSGLLRTALRYSGADLITLKEELAFIREYLDLEMMRLGSRLKTDWLIDSLTEQVLVPQMILQPLVENAIRHGIADSREQGWIEISAQKTNGLLELRIRNSTGGKQPNEPAVGLRNTEARLKHLYASEGTLCFVLSDDGTAITTLHLPALGTTTRRIREVTPNSSASLTVTTFGCRKPDTATTTTT